MRRKTVLALGAIVVLIALAALAIPALVDVNRHRPLIESRLRSQLGREVQLGRMSLSLFPPALRVENARIAEHPAFETFRPFAEVDTLYVRVRLAPLLRREVHIDSLQLRAPRLELVRNADGEWNFMSLAPSGEDPVQTASMGETPPAFSLARLVINDGQVAVTDEQRSGTRTVYDHIDVTLDDFAPTRPFSLQVRARLPEGGGTVTFEGDAGPISAASLAALPLDATLHLDDVSLAGLRAFLHGPAFADSDAVLTGRTALRNQGGRFSAEGGVEAQGIRVRGVDLGYPVTAAYEIAGDINQSTFTIQRTALNLGGASIGLEGRIDTTSSPATVDLRLQAADAPMTEVARLAAAFGVAFTPDAAVQGVLGVDVRAEGPTDRPALNGRVEAREIRVTGAGLAEPVDFGPIDLALSPDAIRSNSFTASTGAATATAQITLSGHLSDAPQLEARIRTGDADVVELLRLASAYGISAVEGLGGSGMANMDLLVRGPLTPPGQLTVDLQGRLQDVEANTLLSSISTIDDTLFGRVAVDANTRFIVPPDGAAGIARTLNGRASLQLAEGRIVNLNLLDRLGAIADFLRREAGTAPAESFTELIQMSGDFDIVDGLARTENLQAAIEGGRLGAVGAINLVSQELNLQMTAVLSREFSEAVGGRGVGGLLRTALSNPEGELVIPFNLTGAFASPQVTPDLNRVAEMQLQQLLPSTRDPVGITRGLIDRLRGEAQPPPASPPSGEGEATEPEEPTPGEVIDSILDIFRNR